ncbi:PaaI family thioesterase [Bordetella sp. 2513F-2]
MTPPSRLEGELPVGEDGALDRVRASFARQTVMGLIGAALGELAPGRVEIRLPYRADLCQQNGYLHAGIVTTIADSAGGYAALSVFGPQDDVLTAEFKMNFLAPAAGEAFVATGRVLKAGGRLAVCQAEVHAWRDGAATLCVAGMMTLVRMTPR